MRTFDQMPEGWDATSAAYEDVVAPFTGQWAEDALVLAGVRAGERVLDVAAGTGALALRAAARGADVLATDFSPGMVERLRARALREGLGERLRAEVMDGQALAVGGGEFDAAFSIFGLIFFPDRAAGFREMRRALGPGGRAVVAGWCGPERVATAQVILHALATALPDLPLPPAPPPVVSLADAERFAEEMRAAGFEDVRIETVTHDFVAPSSALGWDRLAGAAPPIQALFRWLEPARAAAVRDAAVAYLRERFGDGEVRLSCAAHLGIGRRGESAS